jgi:hypothetical protein
MRIFKILILIITIVSLTSCASAYKKIEPKTINYLSTNSENGIKLEYKYDLLQKKYEKKEKRKGVKLVAVKITNESEKDVMFGREVKLTYENGTDVEIIENEKVFKALKQSPATYLFYLLLTPANFYTTKSTYSSTGYEEDTSSFPIGLILGPGLAGGNMIAASSANADFKSELLVYNINGLLIKAGETKYGLIGIKSHSFAALKIVAD